MPFLLLRILFTVTFSHLLRFSQARTARPLGAAAVNYALAAGACGAWTLAVRCAWHPLTAVLGALAGVTYVTSLLMILPAMRRSGVAVTGAVVQLSLMLPVAVAVWRFHEYPGPWQVAGIGLTVIALPILSASSSGSRGNLPAGSGISLLTALLFLSTGASQVFMKEFSADRPGTELPFYSACLFGTSAVLTVLWVLITGDSGRQPEEEPIVKGGWLSSEWVLGALLGTANTLQLVTLLMALRALPAVVVFPVSAALGIAANALASTVFWQERPTAAGWIGISIAIGAVVLLNVK